MCTYDSVKVYRASAISLGCLEGPRTSIGTIQNTLYAGEYRLARERVGSASGNGELDRHTVRPAKSGKLTCVCCGGSAPPTAPPFSFILFHFAISLWPTETRLAAELSFPHRDNTQRQRGQARHTESLVKNRCPFTGHRNGARHRNFNLEESPSGVSSGGVFIACNRAARLPGECFSLVKQP